MIRKINFTGRKKIPRSRISVTLIRLDNGDRSFDACIDLRWLDLTDDAKVFVEAYHRASYMRFPFGSVSAISPAVDRRLTGIDPGSRPLFRVKVVDRIKSVGRILASAERIVPIDLEQENKGKQWLLIVEFKDLGDLVWRLDMDGDWPTLQLNERVENIREMARSDGQFMSLVYPEVLRQVLTETVVERDHTDPDCNDDDWPTFWLRYACGLSGVPNPPVGNSEQSRQAKRDWIDEAVVAFCKSQKVLKRLEESLGERG